jgi:hypothetical protein
MGAPVYNHDLIDINLAESTSGYQDYLGTGGAAPSGFSSSPTFAMQGTNAIDKGFNGAGNMGIMSTSNTIDLSGGKHVYFLFFVASPNVTRSIEDGGVCVSMGSSTSNFVSFHVEGNDTYGAGGRVGKSYAVNYVNTASAVVPFRTVIGSPPTSNPTTLGAKIDCTTTGRAGYDCIRYGTGAYITDGEIANPATFTGFSTQNDLVANRWGIAVTINGSIEIQGKFVIGQDSAGTPTECYFDDANVDLLFVDCIHSEPDFNEIIIDHSLTTCNWNNVNIKALGTNSRGKITVNANDPTFPIIGGVWTSIDTTTLQLSSSLIGTVWRDTESITTNGATLTNFTVDLSRAISAVVSASLSELINGTFASAGTGYAVDLGTISATISMAWDCSDSGYAATDGSTGNETILVSVDSGQTLTINVNAGKTTPTINNVGAGTVVVLSGSVSINVNVKDETGLNIENALVYIDDDLGVIGNLANTLSDASGNITQIDYSGVSTVATLRIRLYGYKPHLGTISLTQNSTTNIILNNHPQQI